MKITLNVSEDCEATESPWWAIVDPQQNFKTNDEGLHNIASMITGPYFSREAAETHLAARRHAFGNGAKVFCFSGYWSHQYKEAMRNAKKESK